MSHHSTVLMFHVSPPSLLDRLDSTLVPTRSRMGTSRLLASGGFDKGNGHSRSMLTRDLGPYPFNDGLALGAKELEHAISINNQE